MQRKDHISWDGYFMGIVLLSKERSKDPSTQVGACIVSKDKRVLSLGYNGTPVGIEDGDFPWRREGSFIDTKYAYVCHAELNAILNYKGSNRELEGAIVYVTLFPCNECAKAIIQTGIKKIVYYEDKYSESDSTIVSKKMFDQVGIEYVPYKKEGKEVIINI